MVRITMQTNMAATNGHTPLKMVAMGTSVTEDRIKTSLFNVRQGLIAEDDKLPLRYFQPKTNGALSDKALDPERMHQAKIYYCRLMGWDASGVPLPEKIRELEIDL